MMDGFLRGNTIPVIGLWQPYASLVAVGAKPWETRHFAPPTRLVGKRVAIQATLRKPTHNEMFDFPPEVYRALGADWPAGVPYGAVVCTALLVGGYQVRQVFETGDARLSDLRVISDDGFGDYGIDRWCWQLDDVHQLAVPIRLKGRQAVGWAWEPDHAQRAALCRQSRSGGLL